MYGKGKGLLIEIVVFVVFVILLMFKVIEILKFVVVKLVFGGDDLMIDEEFEKLLDELYGLGKGLLVEELEMVICLVVFSFVFSDVKVFVEVSVFFIKLVVKFVVKFVVVKFVVVKEELVKVLVFVVVKDFDEFCEVVVVGGVKKV